MGRGGPAEPEVAETPPTIDDLLALSRSGRHAASDYLEDAALAGVVTIGCRRAGGGLAGAPFVSNVHEGAALAAERAPDLVIFEGSGAAFPPIDTSKRVLVVGGGQSPEVAAGYLNAYRILVSDLVLVIGGGASRRRRSASSRTCRCSRRSCARVRPRASSGAGRGLHDGTRGRARRDPLGADEQGLDVQHVSSSLADRDALRKELESVDAETFLVELKAAAIDVVAEAAAERGARLVLLGSDVVAEGLDERLLALAEDAVREQVRA